MAYVPRNAKYEKKANSADIDDLAVTTAKLAADAVTNAKVADDAVAVDQLKVVSRNLAVAIGAASATVTTAADIGGLVLGANFTAAADATATEITSVRFIASTGALTVTTNANATAETVIRVNILQA